MTIYDDMAGKYKPGGSAITQSPNMNTVDIDPNFVNFNFKVTHATVAYNSTSPVTIAGLPVGAVVYDVIVNVTTAFAGTSPTLDVGYAGTVGALLATATIAPTVAGVKSDAAEPVMIIDTVAHGQVTATIGGTALTQGAADIYVIWFTA